MVSEPAKVIELTTGALIDACEEPRLWDKSAQVHPHCESSFRVTLG